MESWHTVACVCRWVNAAVTCLVRRLTPRRILPFLASELHIRYLDLWVTVAAQVERVRGGNKPRSLAIHTGAEARFQGASNSNADQPPRRSTLPGSRATARLYTHQQPRLHAPRASAWHEAATVKGAFRCVVERTGSCRLVCAVRVGDFQRDRYTLTDAALVTPLCASHAPPISQQTTSAVGETKPPCSHFSLTKALKARKTPCRPPTRGETWTP